MQWDFLRNEELAGTCEDKFIAGCRFRQNSFFFFLFLHPLRHRVGSAYQAGILSAASGAEMANFEQMKKIVPLCVKLPLVNMSAS